jgi:hypothetical protein
MVMIMKNSQLNKLTRFIAENKFNEINNNVISTKIHNDVNIIDELVIASEVKGYDKKVRKCKLIKSFWTNSKLGSTQQIISVYSCKINNEIIEVLRYCDNQGRMLNKAWY